MSAREISIVIARPVPDVFAYMNDVAREPEWQPQLIEAEQTPPGPTAIGSRRRYVSEFMGRRVENVYVIEQWVPNVEVRLSTTRDSALDATSHVRWEEVPEGTRVSMSVDGKPKGALRFVPRALLEATFESELQAALGRVKAILERT